MAVTQVDKKPWNRAALKYLEQHLTRSSGNRLHKRIKGGKSAAMQQVSRKILCIQRKTRAQRENTQTCKIPARILQLELLIKHLKKIKEQEHTDMPKHLCNSTKKKKKKREVISCHKSLRQHRGYKEQIPKKDYCPAYPLHTCPAHPPSRLRNTHHGCSKLYTSVTMYSFGMVHGGRFVLFNWNDLSHYHAPQTSYRQ